MSLRMIRFHKSGQYLHKYHGIKFSRVGNILVKSISPSIEHTINALLSIYLQQTVDITGKRQRKRHLSHEVFVLERPFPNFTKAYCRVETIEYCKGHRNMRNNWPCPCSTIKVYL